MTDLGMRPDAVKAAGSEAVGSRADDARSQRGVTVIPAQVVARIAAQAAFESAQVGSNAGGLLGFGARRNFRSRPEARCELYGQVAVLYLDLGLVFPAPLVPTVQRVREHVSERVEHLTGLKVGKIELEISWLNPGSNLRRTLS